MRERPKPFHGAVAPLAPVTLAEFCAAFLSRGDRGLVFSHSTAARLLGLPLPRRWEREGDLHVSAMGAGQAPRTRNVIGHHLRIAIEYEGDVHRLDRDTFRDDIDRRERFEDAGWRVIRVTAEHLQRPHALVERIRSALAARAQPRSEPGRGRLPSNP